jgi:hypothetical protein
MKGQISNKPLLGREIYTLAQNGTGKSVRTSTKSIISVNGKGSDISTNEIIHARNKRKLITQKLSLCLIDVAKQKGHLDSVKEYWNTFHCLNIITTDGNRIHGKYCKNRICTVCSGNRKAELINKYLPIINQWKEPYFVTLTIRSVPARRLHDMMKAMLAILKRIIGKYKSRNKRGKDILLKGIRSLECNFNPIARTYNPHFHIIVPDKETADILVKEWLYYCNRNGTFWASKNAQKPIKIRENENEICLVEVIKYGCKIITRPKKDGVVMYDLPAKIYISALHNILRAMKGLRLFERFGFNLPKTQKETTIKELYEYDILVYDSKIGDWIDTESELRLSDYILPPELKEILDNADMILE